MRTGAAQQVIVEWNRRIRQQGAMSRLAADVLSSAAPLLEYSDVRIRLLAAEVRRCKSKSSCLNPKP
jgi:hypothetical protein